MPKATAPKTKPVKATRPRAKDQDTGRRVAVRSAVNTSTMAAAALVPVDKPLTTQQREFVKHWAAGDSIPNAMARAGYNDQPSYGYRMAKMPNILALYNEEKRLYEEASQMTRKRVMDMLVEDAVETLKAQELGLNFRDTEIQSIPTFWEKGIRYFNIYGPNGETIEFCQIVK